MSAASLRPFALPRLFAAAWFIAFAATLPPLAAQTIPQRGERLPEPPKPKTLSIRESTFSSVVTKASAIYRKEADSQTFVLESNEGEPRLEWRIGGEARPLPEGAPGQARLVERRVKFVPHEDKLFVKIESVAKDPDGREAEDVRFSGTYETTVLEGTWAGYREGKPLKVRISAADHERYQVDMRKAFFGEAALATHADRFRKELIGILERKIAEPGNTPSKEIEMVGQLVAIVKAHPEAFVVLVTPSYEADPEIFLLEGDSMHSTTERQATTLRFDAKLPALAVAP